MGNGASSSRLPSPPENQNYWRGGRGSPWASSFSREIFAERRLERVSKHLTGRGRVRMRVRVWADRNLPHLCPETDFIRTSPFLLKITRLPIYWRHKSQPTILMNTKWPLGWARWRRRHSGLGASFSVYSSPPLSSQDVDTALRGKVDWRGFFGVTQDVPPPSFSHFSFGEHPDPRRPPSEATTTNTWHALDESAVTQKIFATCANLIATN